MISKFNAANAEPKGHPDNPGQDSWICFSFEREAEKGGGVEQWSEEIDLVEVLREVLVGGGWSAERQGDWLVAANGLWLKPRFVEHAHPADAILTSTTIEVAHSTLLSLPCFEYQHSSSGESATASIRAGFEQWMRMDWRVFEDLAAPSLRHCSEMIMNFPEASEGALHARRVLFGPVAHRASRKAADLSREEHLFCPCCLFTNTLEAFMPQLRSKDVFGIRLYAARDASGEVMADCRVNGEDWPAGAEALRAYAASWPDRGFESRKQYVLIGPAPEAVFDSVQAGKCREGVNTALAHALLAGCIENQRAQNHKETRSLFW